MSGRAVRRALQRQREQELLATPDHDSSSETDDLPSQPAPKPSLFALLGGDENDDEDEEKPDSDVEEEAPIAPTATPAKSKSKKKKKKKKAKKEAKKPDTTGNKAEEEEEEEEEDDIDRALRQLKLESKDSGDAPADTGAGADGNVPLSEVLKVDSRNLDAANEMRRLFGRDAMRGDAPEPEPRPRGQRGRGRGAFGNRGLPTGRRNAFVQPKEEWPNAGSGGLGMEVKVGSEADEKLKENEREGEFTEYAFVHGRGYQDVQRQFLMCVESMDPQRIVHLSHYNPYHVTTLLQSSEIFHHQRDYNISGDLLERALFTMGRSLHSTFSSNLSSGKARLSFRRPENRDLYLAIWRYIKNLSQRGTWRTAAEFGFLLFSLDPFGDPYEISLLLDYLCLKARQTSRLLTLLEHPALHKKFLDRPNIAFSRAVAHHQLGNTFEAQEYLAKAITKFPWIPGMITKELNVDFEPTQALWGVFPPDDNPRQQLLAALYIEHHKELWKEPQLISLLRNTAATIHSLPRKSPLANTDPSVTVPMSRHVFLTENQPLMRHVPIEIRTSHDNHSFDLLIPLDNIQSYDRTPARGTTVAGAGGVGGVGEEETVRRQTEALATELANGPLETVVEFFRSLLPWMAAPGEDGLRERETEEGRAMDEAVANMRRVMEDMGVPVEEALGVLRREVEERDEEGRGEEN
ncbi:DUF654-domain-containing protein [Ascodesmis nigricans]|uniref:DUF654-domain-containing protein n=1 Tax=Ascodesmis nigricans TaxID=341454 RepID=A0A4S2MT80_9PEZI|nr:DUF654-domain-containing protein [Ascodesmis nigricans]